jgi:putative alpha-1,2-mannosidase
MSPILQHRTSTTISTNKRKACKCPVAWDCNSKRILLSNLLAAADILPYSFKDAPYGVPGNSDAGAMNSWLLWQMLGIYPVVTQPVYLISSPWFPDLNMTINGNHTLRITATGLDQGYYVQSVKINGKAWTKNWFEHDDLMVEGGTIEFELGPEMKSWETGPVPPSPGHVRL